MCSLHTWKYMCISFFNFLYQTHLRPDNTQGRKWQKRWLEKVGNSVYSYSLKWLNCEKWVTNINLIKITSSICSLFFYCHKTRIWRNTAWGSLLVNFNLRIFMTYLSQSEQVKETVISVTKKSGVIGWSDGTCSRIARYQRDRGRA